MSFLEKQRQDGRRVVAVIMAIVALTIIYTQLTDRVVPLPEAQLQALQQAAPQSKVDGNLVEAKRSGGSYLVYVTEVAGDGRRVTYTYEIDESLNVVEKGMSVGFAGPNPVNTALALLLGCALLAYAIFIFARQLLSPRCPHCRRLLGYEFLTLYSGGIGEGGNSLPPIVLRTAKCGSCEYESRKVAVAGDFRPSNAFSAVFARTPFLDDKILEAQQKLREQKLMTDEEWKEMFEQFKRKYEN